MDLTQLSELEIHQLLARLNEELARRHHIQLMPANVNSTSECRGLQIIFKRADKNPEEVYNDLSTYGPIGLRQTTTYNGMVKMMVYYEDSRDAEDAMKKLRDRYNISFIEGSTFTEDPSNGKSDSRKVRVTFKNSEVGVADVARDLTRYGRIGMYETLTEKGTSSLTVTYEDSRDAQDAVKCLADRYTISMVDA